MSENKSSAQANPKGWLNRARILANAGDRWFVTVARNLGGAGGLAAKGVRTVARTVEDTAGGAAHAVRDEASIVAESAQTAADTTVRVGQQLADTLGWKPPPPQPKDRKQMLVQTVRTLAAEHAECLDAITDEQFEKFATELKEEISFELRVLKDSIDTSKNGPPQGQAAKSKNGTVKNAKVTQPKAASPKATASKPRVTNGKVANAKVAGGKPADAKPKEAKVTNGKATNAKVVETKPGETEVKDADVAEAKVTEVKVAEVKAAGDDAATGKDEKAPKDEKSEKADQKTDEKGTG